MADISQKRPDCNYKCCQRKPRANAGLTQLMGEDQGKVGKNKMSRSLQEMQKSLKNEIIVTDISFRFLAAIQRFALLFAYRPFTCSW